MRNKQCSRHMGYVSALMISVAVDAAPQYTLTEVGSIGGRDNVGYGINNFGDIVGQASTDLSGSPSYHAFFYDHGRNLTTDLGTVGGANSRAKAINGCSKVVGYSDIDADGTRHAALLSTRADLGSLGGPVSDAYSINDLGDIVGLATDAHNQWHGTLFGHDGAVTDFGVSTALLAINNRGQILGSDATGSFIFFKGKRTYLPIPGAQVLAISDEGSVVGNLQLPHQITHAFLYFRGKTLDLGTLTPDYGNSSAEGLNDSNEVVGRSDILPPGQTLAFNMPSCIRSITYTT